MQKKNYLIIATTIFLTTASSYLLFRRKKKHEQDKFKCKNQFMNLQNKQLYEEVIIDPHMYDLQNDQINNNLFISQISYQILLNINKGNIYQGVVQIEFKLLSQYKNQYFLVNFNGTTIKNLTINGMLLSPLQFTYLKHEIQIPVQKLRIGYMNNILIIYENKYSFIADGLSSYFILDSNNRYSLKQQMIYSRSGLKQIKRIIPCLNCINKCTMTLNVIHPEGFEVFSNTVRSRYQKCTQQEFPQYSFFFNASDHCSYKLKSSNTSNFQESIISASNSLYKQETSFYPITLTSIHHFFILCSNLFEIKPQNNKKQIPILLRYFCKAYKQQEIRKNIEILHQHLTDIYFRLRQCQIQQYTAKIDIFLMTDRQNHGYYAPGILILDQQCLKNGVNVEIFYLISRAFLAMIRIQKQQQLLTQQQIMHLNQCTINKFSECCNYIFLKQIQLDKVKNLILDEKMKHQYGNLILEYFQHELKFLVLIDCKEKVSSDLTNLVYRLLNDTPEAYWSFFVTNYNFMSPFIAELALQISITYQGIPLNYQWLKQFAHKQLSKSSHLLQFISDKELEINLGKYLNDRTPGLEKRLPKIKVRQKFKKYITEYYEPYLPLSYNKEEVWQIYEQFKLFQQNKNFHHISILNQQICRIESFIGNDLKQYQEELQCGLIAWKLLSKLKIYPKRQQYAAFLVLLNKAL